MRQTHSDSVPWQGGHRRVSPPMRTSPSRAPHGRRRWFGPGRSPRPSWCGSRLDRIERLDPQLNAFRIVLAEKALLEAEQAEARLKAGEERPLLGVPIAIKDEVDVAGEVNTHGTDAFTEPASDGLRDGAAPARGRRDHRRPDPAAGAGDLRLHRVGDLRRHPQPVEPAAHPGRAPAAAPPPRSPRAWCRSPRPATAAARSASRPPPAGSSA